MVRLWRQMRPGKTRRVFGIGAADSCRLLKAVESRRYLILHRRNRLRRRSLKLLYGCNLNQYQLPNRWMVTRTNLRFDLYFWHIDTCDWSRVARNRTTLTVFAGVCAKRLAS